MTTQEILGAIALSAAKNDVVAVNVKYAEDIFNVVYAAVDESEADDVNDWTDDGDTLYVAGTFKGRKFCLRVLTTEEEYRK